MYARELDGARLRGDWDADVATRNGPKAGATLPWSELIRKYMKHNPNQTTTPSVAHVEQQIRSNLTSFYKQEDYSDASHDEDSAQGQTVFAPVLPSNQYGQGWSGDNVSQAIAKLAELRSSSSSSSTSEGAQEEKQSMAAIQAHGLFVLGKDEEAVELLHEVKFLDEVDLTKLRAGDSDETKQYTPALFIMGYVIYGMANERLLLARNDEGYIPFAYAGYARAIDLHEALRGGKKANALRGLPADEIERWAETALYRNALFSVRHGDLPLALNALRAYQAHAGRWPTSFRQPQRNVIYRTYLAVLNRAVETGGYVAPSQPQAALTNQDCRTAAYQRAVVAAAASRVEIRDFETERAPRHGQARRMVGVDARGITSRTTSKRRPAPYRVLRPSSASWSNELLAVQKAAADSINRSTSFPRAGRVNTQALDLADELVRGWRLNGEQGGDYADEVIEILYALSRVTFHSQRISRHLFVLLSAAENYEEARRALDLYVKLVEKAREADAADAAGLVEESRLREKDEGNEVNGNGHDAEEKQANGKPEREALSKEAKEQAQKVHIDSDDDVTYVNTLLYGVHVLVKYVKDARAADVMARKAVEFLEHGQRKHSIASDNFVVARVKRMAGIARAAFCDSESDPLKRPKLQGEALALLKQSATLDAEASETHLHLARLQAEMRDVTEATRSARRAVELEPADIQAWHLLSLLVSAQKDLKGALRVAEEGLAEAEDDDEADQLAALKGLGSGDSPSSGGAAAPIVNGVIPASKPSTSVARTALLSVDFPPRYSERAEATLRLMMTHNALEEVVEGSDAAIEGQREIFEFFHKRVATASAQTVSQRSGIPTSTSQTSRLNNAQPNGSTVLSKANTVPVQFDSPTGLGQSGAAKLSKVQRLNHFKLHQSANSSSLGSSAPSGARQQQGEGGLADSEDTATLSSIRKALHLSNEISLLSSLWLMAAASFRRAGKADECRVAIQEAERVDPAKADVWLQLALWFESCAGAKAKGDDHEGYNLAINSLYKALACQEDHVSAAVHLARLFLDHGESASAVKRLVDHAAAQQEPAHGIDDVRDGVSKLAAQVFHNSHSRTFFSSTSTEADKTQTLAEGDAAKKSRTPGASTASAFASSAEARASSKRVQLASLALAEGLLATVTATKGWACPEAWYLLGRVARDGGRPERQRECLVYALGLEKKRSIRDYACVF